MRLSICCALIGSSTGIKAFESSSSGTCEINEKHQYNCNQLHISGHCKWTHVGNETVVNIITTVCVEPFRYSILLAGPLRANATYMTLGILGRFTVMSTNIVVPMAGLVHPSSPSIVSGESGLPGNVMAPTAAGCGSSSHSENSQIHVEVLLCWQ